jgi:hypothetical protein
MLAPSCAWFGAFYSIHFEKLQDLTAHKQVDKIEINSKTSKNTYAYKPLKIVLSHQKSFSLQDTNSALVWVCLIGKNAVQLCYQYGTPQLNEYV